MTNKNYESGRNFEYRVKKFLEQKGYYVMRSAGSKTPFDLIATPTKENMTLLPSVLLIQCKHGAKISKKELKAIRTMDKLFISDVVCMVAWSERYGHITFYYKDGWTELGWL